MHEEEVDHIAVDADEPLGGIGNDGREANDEGNKGDGAEAGAHPKQDHRSYGDDWNGLQEDGIGVKHAADPRELGEEKRNDKAYKKGG
jgi:hypothetical protein